MKIYVSNEVKERIVRIGILRAFGSKKGIFTTVKERIVFFDKVWSQSLKSSLEKAIQHGIFIAFSVIKQRVKNQFKRAKNPEQYVDEQQNHYEFTARVLFVAQLKELHPLQEYEMDQLWSFTYTETPPELFCFEFDSVKDKENFEHYARQRGGNPRNLVKRTILERMNQEINNLVAKKKTLEADIEKLEEEFRKSNIAFYKRMLQELRERLDKDYPEAAGKDSWQSWIYANNWLLGTQYRQPLAKQKVGFGNIPDFIFPTLDGFIDIIEIKKPDISLIKLDKSHADSYLWSPVGTQAIGQVVTYLHKIELHQLEISQQINRQYATEVISEFYIIKPRAYILAGRSNEWSSSEKEAFRKLNYALNGIEVLTYDDLIHKGESLVELYTREIR